MSTSDQDGNRQLTRKQLRELRLTGSTPVISEEEAANAAQPTPVLPGDAEPIVIEPAPESTPEAAEDAPLTRRQARELERSRTAPVAVVEEEADAADAPVTAETATVDAQDEPEVVEEPGVAEKPAVADEPQPIVSEVPRFDVPASKTSEPAETEPAAETDSAEASADDIRPVEEPEVDAGEPGEEPAPERPMVGAAFGIGVKADESAKHVPSRFDSLLDGDSGGSQHTATNALIFTHGPGVGSLSGPVAATGELLITGTYQLPEGLGSRGHALGVADGKDVDAVLIDGELAPASSPTPIAASSAVSTSKPAGEVIRPPAPEKGNKLMLTLAVVAGGLALALATVLIIAFTTNVFG